MTSNSHSNRIRSQMETNEYIDERSAEMGETAEQMFDKAVKAQGKSVRKASRYEERVQHIDRWIGDKRWRPNKNQPMRETPPISG